VPEKSPKPLGFSETVGVASGRGNRRGMALGNVGCRPRLAVAPRVRNEDGDHEPPPPPRARSRCHGEPDDRRIEALVKEWLLELRMMGRSPRTIEW
jgi:hypothetical protein